MSTGLQETSATLNSMTYQVVTSHFRAIVEEMSANVLRAAHTTFIKETQDYATALLTPQGEMFAYPQTTGVTSLLGMPTGDVLAQVGNWEPGDVLISNDPYHTRGMVTHLPDLTLIRPLFVDGQVLCFAWAFLHSSDVGGVIPGSIDMRSREIFQEGIRIRPVKLLRAGVLNDELWNIIADNCRIPTQNWGDVSAILAALARSEERIQRLAQKHGRDAVRDAMYWSLDRTEAKTRIILASIPRGEYRFTDYLEEDYDSGLPVRISVALRPRSDGSVELDYSGSDPQVNASLNLPVSGQKHHPFLCMSLMNFVVTRAEGIDWNSGILRCIDLILPKYSIVNASYPAACGMRYITGMRCHDVVLGALARALPGSVPAAGAGGVSVTAVSVTDLGSGAVRVAVANPVYGGSGGRERQDGIDGLDHPLAFFRNVPAEILEAEMPVLVHGFGLVEDSEGAGKFRGGFAVRFVLEVLHPDATVVMRGKERYAFAPWGVAGGLAGSTGTTEVARGSDAPEAIGKAPFYRPVLGEKIVIRGQGGGGFGSPFERDPEAVRTDVADGLLSPQRAEDVYGVVLSGDKVDADATARRRKSPNRSNIDGVDRGPGWESWRRTEGAHADRISDWLWTLPPQSRAYAKKQAFARATSTAAGEIDLVLNRLGEELGALAAPDAQEHAP